jgi:acyl-CoA thioester hydrolase
MTVPTNSTETTFRVRYAETDQMGIVHHAVYVEWLEEGRSHWMRAHGTSYVALEAEGLFMAVSEIQLRYHRPARYDQRVTIRCWVEEVRSRLLKYGYEVLEADSGLLLVNGYTRHICMNSAGKATQIPSQWLELLRQGAV